MVPMFTPTPVDPPLGVSDLDELFNAYPLVMSVPQVAEVLGVSPSTIYNWLANGTIPASKINYIWIIYRHDIRQLLAAGRNERIDDP